MRSSPRRPLILKRRKLALSAHSSSGKNDNGGQDEPDGRLKVQSRGHHPDNKAGDPRKQKFPDGIKIVNHPTMPNTQVVVIPKSADIQSIITALTTKGKECGSNGPNKFILVSSGGSSDSSQHNRLVGLKKQLKAEGSCSLMPDGGKAPSGNEGMKREMMGNMELRHMGMKKESEGIPESRSDLLTVAEFLKEENLANTDTEGSPLDDSLTNIQWLGKMSSDGLGPCSVKQEEEKENAAEPQGGDNEVEKDSSSSLWKDSFSERPPYSYMAMIQFAINSTHNQRMTLKEIYTWIETHFPYFKHTAKPGWKNSIRHNLSLHDMFVRETSNNGKISFWTIRPESNRCLTLDQVVKQQKHPVPDPPRLITGSNGERKIKPLLPRTSSYLVPIQLPISTSLIVQPSLQLPLPSIHSTLLTHSELTRRNKRVRIAPKVTMSNEAPQAQSLQLVHFMKDEKPPQKGPRRPETPIIKKRRERSERSSSRRKQKHVLPPTEEPVLLFPDGSHLDSGLVSDCSSFQESQVQEHGVDFNCIEAESTFKTPIKEKSREMPASSTPSKNLVGSCVLGGHEPWKVTPLKKEGTVFDVSPVRTPCGVTLTPMCESTDFLSFNSTPFREAPLFDSPRELLNTRSPITTTQSDPHCPSLESQRAKGCFREVVGVSTPVNRSLTEGLVLDTMNDSLSKILLDISFTGLEDEDFGVENISWSQFIPELK
nr:PREDICTED: forkhead box protein M1 isoform X2 [Latimeria chalumnae]|eukprot:XP_014348076.1 PREDICTED: forkhead box protein M1 isoform X2 [Latimeria chalumnae]